MKHEDSHIDQIAELFEKCANPRQAFTDSPISQCETCRTMIQEIGTVANLLDNTAQTERTVIEKSKSISNPELEQLVQQSLRDRIPRSSPSRSWLVLAIAASFVAAAVWFWGSTSTPETPIDPGLTLDASNLHPYGLVDNYGVLRWDSKAPTNGWFVVKVWDHEFQGTEPLFESAPLKTPQWTPPPRIEQVPKIYWQSRHSTPVAPALACQKPMRSVRCRTLGRLGKCAESRPRPRAV